ncbi:helix-turn-helix transcriptional regulator [Oleiphilus sp. HI0080]|uniref:helix-turn-helix domain-containing protein n=1 Tax=Oleiphilus sp. HI0080 TaxID=1822255 RepID=UPI000A9800B6|nr:helix-turn-helix transcriptional regulator [Oleiphilus sp. HI0080]
MTKEPDQPGKAQLSEDELVEELRNAIKADQDARSQGERRKTGNSANPPEQGLPDPWVSEEAISGLFERIGSAAGQAVRFAKRTTDTSYKVGKALIQSQDQLKLMLAAGQSLKDLREVAGLTVSELSDALQLKDKSLLEAVENGTATLSFELILRLSALLARNDPIPFILKYSRTYSPETWKLLHDWGAGRLPLQYQREREFINIYRSQDNARQLSDEGFAHVLAFTKEAFNTALHFAGEQEGIAKKHDSTRTTPPPKKSK